MKRRAYGTGSVSYHAAKQLYYVRVNLGRKPDGSRNVKTVYDQTEHGAERKAAELTGKRRNGQLLTSSTPTIAVMLEDWFATFADDHDPKGWAPSTQRSYRLNIDRYLVPALGRYKVDALSPNDVQRWLTAQKREHGARRTLQLAHATLRSALAWAISQRMVSFNAADGLFVPTPTTTRPRRFLTVEQAIAFRKVADQHPLGALFTVALSVGMRLGEATGLRWTLADGSTGVDPETGLVRIVQQLQRVQGGALVLRRCKTAKSERELVLPAFARAELQRWRARQLQYRLKAGKGWVDSGLVFTTYCARGDRKAGRPLQPRNVSRLLDELLVKAGMPGAISFHGFRHSAASLLIAAGLTKEQIAQVLGHSDPRLTEKIYGHLMKQTATRAAVAMDGMF